ncbi:NAD(P)-dependent dehydrogenase (short-subunit alcohol dehydrogenase family) [Geodermatophilus bullaregiensis]|uniref:SDR family NAD(P)-dependent oxidoreductase n=1 Tax=Geodermatophilus bullaregiensis TaxID=1564160 RepID=UPI001957AC44|nr:SDR family NAD(P)-dependent oxidoreductase [Geodermatophilus bullaregiensis]MBM7807185.1 NAD(P)-dependent dehydrogenase (short-subunit alcohol dehydrogenase family) [Geodermatophilus bullaregiensis]
MADDPSRPAVAVVTGAASGLGAAVAGALTAAGWRVAAFDLRPSPATALGVEVDVTDAAAVEAAVDRVERELGPVGALVTAAGVYEILPVEEIDDARWHRMMAVNLSGTANACAAVVPRMVSRGEGGVVTVSSDLGVGGSQGDAHYAASKGAIVGFTRALATEVGGTGVAVNTVAPGAADTPMLEDTSPWRSADFLGTLPVQRLVRPDEIAAAALFLLEAGTALCGQVLSPNAGATI